MLTVGALLGLTGTRAMVAVVEFNLYALGIASQTVQGDNDGREKITRWIHGDKQCRGANRFRDIFSAYPRHLAVLNPLQPHRT